MLLLHTVIIDEYQHNWWVIGVFGLTAAIKPHRGRAARCHSQLEEEWIGGLILSPVQWIIRKVSRFEEYSVTFR